MNPVNGFPVCTPPKLLQGKKFHRPFSLNITLFIHELRNPAVIYDHFASSWENYKPKWLHPNHILKLIPYHIIIKPWLGKA